jgi:primosomal protein N'
MLDDPLLYALIRELQNVLTSGMFIKVSFERTKRLGLIFNLHQADGSKSSFRVKEILNIESDFPLLSPDLIKLIFWMHTYHPMSHKSWLETMAPLAIRQSISPKVVTNLPLMKVIFREGREILERCSPKQYALYEFLLKSNRTLEKSARTVFLTSTINSLLDKGIVGEIFERANRRVCGNPMCEGGRNNGKNATVTAEQQNVADDIIKSVLKAAFCPHLIHDLTNSGKTEIHPHGMKNVLESGGDIIYLVRELAIKLQKVHRIRPWINLPADQVMVWQNGLSEKERRDA